MIFDLVIIGAGPAGLSAAAQAAELGLSVAILDEQEAPGGQIYRDVDRVSPVRGSILGKDFTEGAALTAGLRHENISYFAGAVLWLVEGGTRVHFTIKEKSRTATAKRILLATGALERPMPLAGWTLPGVMTAGAGQILLKQSGLVSTRAVLVGTGPLLYLLAAQMLRAGVPPLAMVETQTSADLGRALRHIGGAMRGWRYMLKGIGMLWALRRAGVPRYTAASQIRIEGRDCASAVCFEAGGKARRIEAETVYLHHGIVPNTQAARSVGVGHVWDAAQACFAPVLDVWGQSDVPTVFIAGDGAGIGGAKVAAHAGRVAALRIAEQLGKISAQQRDHDARVLFQGLRRERAIRPFLDAAYPPLPEALLPQDQTIVCRCEEVTAGQVRGYAKLGCLGPNQAKAFGRVGMGPCQGRYCGLTVSALLAEANGQGMDETGYYRIRAPIKPVTLQALAELGELWGDDGAGGAARAKPEHG